MKMNGACPFAFAGTPGQRYNAGGPGYSLQVLISLRFTPLHSGLSAAIPHAA